MAFRLSERAFPETVRGTPNVVATWVVMLAISDEEGVVPSAADRIAEITGMDRLEVVLALSDLAKASGHIEDKGGGVWRVMDRDAVQAPALTEYPVKNREKQKKWRERAGQIEPSEQALELYGIYPRKMAKQPGLIAIDKAIEIIGYTALKEAVTAYADCVTRWPPERKRFIPLPSTWFNQRRWEDDRSLWEPEPPRNCVPLNAKMQMLAQAISEHPANRESAHYEPDKVTSEMIADLHGKRAQYRQLRDAILQQ